MSHENVVFHSLTGKIITITLVMVKNTFSAYSTMKVICIPVNVLIYESTASYKQWPTLSSYVRAAMAHL